MNDPCLLLGQAQPQTGQHLRHFCFALLGVVPLGGLFWWRASTAAGFWTLALVPFGLAAFFAGEVFGLFDIQFLYATGLMFLISLVVFVVISLATDPPPARTAEITWSRETWRRESAELSDTPWYKNYRVLALVLGVVTIGSVVPFV